MTQVLAYHRKHAGDPVHIALAFMAFALVLLDPFLILFGSSNHNGLRSSNGLLRTSDLLGIVIVFAAPVAGTIVSTWLLGHIRHGPRRDVACVIVALALHVIAIYSAARGEVMALWWIFD